jgi:CRISPR type I-E-associated protein CasB/Cse2
MNDVEAPRQALWQQRQNAVLAFAGLLASQHFSPGDRAELRRLEPDDFNRTAFWRLLVGHVPEDLRSTEAAEARWAMLLHGMALMAPQHHRSGRSVGRALAEAGLPEPRLEQLVRARGPQQWPALRRLCQFLAARAAPIDWADFSTFILADNEDKAEEQRRRLARDYYAIQARNEKKG